MRKVSTFRPTIIKPDYEALSDVGDAQAPVGFLGLGTGGPPVGYEVAGDVVGEVSIEHVEEDGRPHDGKEVLRKGPAHNP